MAVGDAAVAFDPLSSLGINNALETGLRAAEAIHAALSGHEKALTPYASFLHDRLAESERLRLSFYAMEQRWRQEPFWRRRTSPREAESSR